MKNMKYFIIIILYLLLVTACKEILLFSSGVRQPKEETDESIIRYLEKNHQSLEGQYRFTDSVAFAEFINDSLFKKKLIGSVFFTDSGIMVNFWDTSKCMWSTPYYLKLLSLDTSFQIDTNYRYQNLFRKIIPLVPVDQTFPDGKKYDYTIVLTWAKYFGKFNGRQFSFRETASQNSKARIRVVYLNTDLQKSWNMSKSIRLTAE
jgi:hypothetical protein